MEDQEMQTPGDTSSEATQEETKKTPPKKSKTSALEEQVASLQKQLQESNDKYLRMLAEYDNYRRRSTQEKDSTYARAVADTIKDLLPIADNLDRASAAEGDAESIRHGLEMTMTSLQTMMTKLGIESFGKEGETFDPNLHNAVMHEDNPDLGENVISQVFQVGYKKGDHIIRFAMVKVAN